MPAIRLYTTCLGICFFCNVFCTDGLLQLVQARFSVTMEVCLISALPLVSAVVPAYNAERYIETTLQALVAQNYSHVEIIVVDDGSTDRTFAVAATLAQTYPQIRILQQPNQGVAAARNRGIAEARGEFVAPIDADDIWFPHAVTKLLNRFSTAGPRTGVVYGWSVTLDETGVLDGGLRCSTIAGKVFATLVCHNFLGNASATLIRRECLEQVGGYDPLFRAESTQGCEDWDLYIRLAESYQFAVVPEFLFGYRRLQTSMSANSRSMARSHDYMLEKVKQRHPQVPRAVYQLSKSSYYLYLAYECQYYGNPRDSMYWLQQAAASGPLFTYTRFGFYRLMIRNLAALRGIAVNQLLTQIRFPLAKRKSSSPTATVTVADIEKQRLRIRLKLAAQEVLHGVAQLVPVAKNI